MSWRRWTEEEVKFLKENYKKMECLEIAMILNRSVTSVAQKAKNLGLKKKKHSNGVFPKYLKQFKYIYDKTRKEKIKERAKRVKELID